MPDPAPGFLSRAVLRRALVGQSFWDHLCSLLTVLLLYSRYDWMAAEKTNWEAIKRGRWTLSLASITTSGWVVGQTGDSIRNGGGRRLSNRGPSSDELKLLCGLAEAPPWSKEWAFVIPQSCETPGEDGSVGKPRCGRWLSRTGILFPLFTQIFAFPKREDSPARYPGSPKPPALPTGHVFSVRQSAPSPAEGTSVDPLLAYLKWIAMPCMRFRWWWMQGSWEGGGISWESFWGKARVSAGRVDVLIRDVRPLLSQRYLLPDLLLLLL